MAQETLLLSVETSASHRKLNKFHKSMMAFDNQVKKLQGSLNRLATVSKSAWDKFGKHVRNARRRLQVGAAKMTKALMSLKGVLTGLSVGASFVEHAVVNVFINLSSQVSMVISISC